MSQISARTLRAGRRPVIFAAASSMSVVLDRIVTLGTGAHEGFGDGIADAVARPGDQDALAA